MNLQRRIKQDTAMWSSYKPIGKTIKETFQMQDDFNALRLSCIPKVVIPTLNRSWYAPNSWIPGMRPMPDYGKFYARMRAVNKHAHIDYHVFNSIYPAALYFAKSRHIKYQYNMYREMNEDFLRNNPSPWHCISDITPSIVRGFR